MHQAMRHLVTFDAADGEDTALLNFAQERSFFAQRGGHGDTQYDFIHIIRQLGGCGIRSSLTSGCQSFWKTCGAFGASKETSLV